MWKPYETNCGLWIWAIQIKFDWLIDWLIFLPTHINSLQLYSPQTLLTHLSPEIFVFFFFRFILHLLRVTSPLAGNESSRWSPAMFSHRIPLDFYRLYTRGPGRESLQKLRSVSLRHLCSNMHLLWRRWNCGVQCTCGSSFRLTSEMPWPGCPIIFILSDQTCPSGLPKGILESTKCWGCKIDL